MSVKVIYRDMGSPLLLLGLTNIAARYQSFLQGILERNSSVMQPLKPCSLLQVAERIERGDTSIDAQVDGQLLREFHEEAVRSAASSGNVFYKLDESFLNA